MEDYMRKHGLKRTLAGVTTLCMLAGFMTLPPTSVKAEEGNVLPTLEQFATKEELMTSFDMSTTSGKIHGQKVKFGKDNQQWYIVGKDERIDGDNVVVFSATALKQDTVIYQERKDSYTYEDKEVGANHYGISVLRSHLNELEKTKFSKSEQKLMNQTTIVHEDIKNNSVYALTEKLYPAYYEAGSGSDLITVGTNTANNISDGLELEGLCFESEKLFWLRQSSKNSNYVYYGYCNSNDGLRCNSDSISYSDNPSRYIAAAFDLNLSNILFASAVPAITKEGETLVSAGNGFVLRHASDKLGSAQVWANKKSISVTNAPAGTYLVIQTQNGAVAKAVSGNTVVNAEDIQLYGQAMTDFANCKIWLEKTDTAERITSATLATEEVPIDAELPVITQNPVDAAYNSNESAAELTVAAEIKDEGVLNYQWYQNTKKSALSGTMIPGAINKSYTPDTSKTGITYYYCIVTNVNESATGMQTASVTSNLATVKVVPEDAAKPVITKNPVSAVYNCKDTAVGLSVSATVEDEGALTYQWYKNTTKTTVGGTLIPGATSMNYTPDTNKAGTYYYYCVVTNSNPNATGIQSVSENSD